MVHEHSPLEANHLLTPADCPVKYRLFQDIKCHHDWFEEIASFFFFFNFNFFKFSHNIHQN